MAVLGIVAEYNPFHKGHSHLLEETHKIKNFDATVCVMSGNFLQRGEPACCDKWARAEMALKCGVDLVIELPFCFSTRSAYFFARAGIELLENTGIVTHLAFGSESGNLNILKEIATIIAHEPEQYKELLKKHLSQGLSFPLARSKTLAQLIKGDQLQGILQSPNNILAIEYLRVLDELNLPLIPITIKRQGASYHCQELLEYSSAMAIRHALFSNCSITKVKNVMPHESFTILEDEIVAGRAPIATDSLEQAIFYKLRTSTINELKDIYEISEGLEHRFKQAANYYGTLDELRHNIKAKRYSLTRINRTLLYILFNLSKNQIARFDQYGPLYCHILGFSAQGQEILQRMKNISQLRTFSRGSDIKQALEEDRNPVLSEMVSYDVLATDIYSLLFPDPAARKAGRDFTTAPVRV
ncbi:MAG: nucleotidyltransferase [Syntrophomonadaceae bacterium]|nr:nucleotidyltransferase [Syntrophomonadaceae bacterium]MDD3890026.1 nucleotidyltransferase [Syntrophomonadaceae bacterium]MDD4548146.1 nucleotidyltransferase [Syntrophomonadaceae bacterium]